MASKEEKDRFQYDFIETNLDEDMVKEMMSIIDNVENRKADVINWDEKKRLDEATRRSGQFINSELENGTSDGSEYNEEQAVAGATNEREKDIMAGLGDMMSAMEEYDGKK